MITIITIIIAITQDASSMASSPSSGGFARRKEPIILNIVNILNILMILIIAIAIIMIMIIIVIIMIMQLIIIIIIQIIILLHRRAPP